MDKSEFEQLIYQQIPITKAMEFNVLEFTPLKARLNFKVYCYDDDTLLAEYEGKYAAFK